MRNPTAILSCVFLCLALSLDAVRGASTETVAQANYFTDWPAGDSPQEIGKRVAEDFVARAQEGPAVHYKEVCAWYGSLTFAELTRDDDLKSRLIAKFQP